MQGRAGRRDNPGIFIAPLLEIAYGVTHDLMQLPYIPGLGDDDVSNHTVLIQTQIEDNLLKSLKSLATYTQLAETSMEQVRLIYSKYM
jgi:hypothetical protein